MIADAIANLFVSFPANGLLLVIEILSVTLKLTRNRSGMLHFTQRSAAQ